MNKEQFMLQLREELRRLPSDEADSAMEYYEEYLEEAGPENEAATIASWGTPAKVASKISAEYEMKQVIANKSDKKGLSAVWVVILAIFASPIAIPVAAALAIVVLALALVVIILVAALGIIALSFAFSGLICVAAGISTIASSFPTFLFFTGAGLFLAGAGIAMCPFIARVSKSGFLTIVKLFNKYLLRRKSS
jgi:uncharacterized membrane protein